MLFTLPDILNEYRDKRSNKLDLNLNVASNAFDSLTHHNMPDSFTYFIFDKYPINATYSKLELPKYAKHIPAENYAHLPKYNIWTNSVLHPEYLNSSSSIDNSADDVSDISSSNNTMSDISSNGQNSFSPKIYDESTPESSSKSIFSPISINDYDIDSSPPSNNDEPSESYDDSVSDTMLPSMELIVPYKRLDLAPSCFINGCVCGHHFEFRDMAYESRRRRNPRSNGVTIRPKTPPISAKLKCCAC